jgi:dihydroorotate dehydrogenase (NAD+) catalytic subunit
MVYECRRAIRIPVVGMGGIASATDALEFIIAGATAVQIGTANFVDPFIWSKVQRGLEDYLQRHSIARLTDLVGTLDTSTREKEWVSS